MPASEFSMPTIGEYSTPGDRCDAFAGPAIAVARLEAVAVEEAGNKTVAGDQHQLTHGLDSIGRSAVALSAPALGQAQLAMSAAHPVDDENDLGPRVVDIGHDLMDEGTYNALLEASIRRRRIPDRFEVRCENAERSRSRNGYRRRRIIRGDLALDLRRMSERLVPARFSSLATSRFAGSAASYCRKARSAA